MKKSITVIGIGNPYRGDDGIGIFLIQELSKRYPDLKEKVEIIDGGTGGMNLYHLLASYPQVILVDAVDFHKKPGDFAFFSYDEIVSSFKKSSTISTHTSDIYSVIKQVKTHEKTMPEIFIFGIQPKQVLLTKDFSKELKNHIPCYIDALYHEVNGLLKKG